MARLWFDVHVEVEGGDTLVNEIYLVRCADDEINQTVVDELQYVVSKVQRAQ